MPDDRTDTSCEAGPVRMSEQFVDLQRRLVTLSRSEESAVRALSQIGDAIRSLAQAPPIPAKPRQPVHALFVDDSSDDRELFRRIVKQSAFEWRLRCAASYEEACIAIANTEGALHLLVVDYQLGEGHTGLDIVQFAARRGWRVPTIMLTAYGVEELRDDPRVALLSTITTKEVGLQVKALDGLACAVLAHGEWEKRRNRLLTDIAAIAGIENPHQLL